MTILEPGTGSPVLELLFNFFVVLLFGGLAVLIARTLFFMSLLWIMPIARVLSFVPPIRRWIERKTAQRAGLVLVLFAAATAAHVARAQAGDTTAARFYTGKSFGTEAEFNPLSEILNEGFDITQTNDQDRHMFSRDYAIGVKNVWQSVTHPGATFRFYGVHRALVNEWLPLSAPNNTGGGAWVPNYEYHLIGSGMISVRMAEWYRFHGVGHPEFAAVATVLAAHFANEVLENGQSRVPNEDATTDLLLFDVGGILLWRVDAVQRLFSGPLQLTNWPGQPSLDVGSRTLQNAAQQFVLRAPLPGTQRWKLLYDFGMSSLLGVSYEKSNGDGFSVAFGEDAVANPVVDPRTGAKGATLRFKGGVFYDRSGSLLASLQVGSRSDNAVVNANVYPGALRGWLGVPGLWLQLPRSGGVRFGIASGWGLGIGSGPER